MPWERRGGGLYYYRKRRVGDKVISDYIGSGELAEAIAHIDDQERQERDAERERWRQERQAEVDMDRHLDSIGDQVRELVAAALLVAGYHTHSGTWRRRRG